MTFSIGSVGGGAPPSTNPYAQYVAAPQRQAVEAAQEQSPLQTFLQAPSAQAGGIEDGRLVERARGLVDALVAHRDTVAVAVHGNDLNSASTAARQARAAYAELQRLTENRAESLGDPRLRIQLNGLVGRADTAIGIVQQLAPTPRPDQGSPPTGRW